MTVQSNPRGYGTHGLLCGATADSFAARPSNVGLSERRNACFNNAIRLQMA